VRRLQDWQVLKIGECLVLYDYPFFTSPYVSKQQTVQGAMVFANTESKDGLVGRDIEEVFFVFRTKVLSEVSMAKVLGYPVSGRPDMDPVRYRDMTEMATLWKVIGKEVEKDVGNFYVPAIEYVCGGNLPSFQASIHHFREWADTAKTVGVTLMHDSTSHAVFENWKRQ